MFRVRRCRLAVSALCFFHFGLLIHSVIAECWYNDELHAEGMEVTTNEPCLNCTCSKGALRCYLQVCPLLPNPPPPGCILLHRFQTCCQELVCTDNVFGNDNFLERRSDDDESNDLEERAPVETACVVNGSIYGPGSAMDSSSLCEYCYCLGGKQVCVKPKCLLSTENCLPIYKSSNCCPIQYQCNYTTTTMSTTTTIKSKEVEQTRGGCIVDGVRYKEGDKVLGAGHSECDNCYCLQDIVRCEPLSCAPPLFGCSPVIRPGECCAISYNCSGVIEIKPEPNYGEFPTVSKDYAKLHKEVQHKFVIERNTENPSIHVYNLPENLRTTKVQRNTNSIGTTRYLPYPSLKLTTTEAALEKSFEDQNDKANIYFDSGDLETQTHDSENIFISLLDDRLNRKIEAQDNNTLEDMTTTVQDETTTVDYVQTTDSTSITEEFSTETTTEQSTDSTDTTSYVVTMQTVLNSTDCINTDTVFQVSNEINDITTKHSNQTKILPKINDMIETKNNQEADEVDANSTKDVIINMSTNKNQDYEYDYNEPTLPPSLPNLRIIPFVAADALDLQNTEASIKYAGRERVTDPSSYHLFSPPIETEGGFIPKQPPMLESFYENSITSSTTAPHLHEKSCVSENQEVPHGDVIESETVCETCRCLYGDVVCRKIECPGPGPGCRKVREVDVDSSLCCPRYSCADELPHLNSTSNPGNGDRIVSSESTTPPRNISSTKDSSASSGSDYSLDKVLNLLLFNQNDDSVEEGTTIRPKSSTATSTEATRNVQHTSTTTSRPKIKEDGFQKPETSTVDANSPSIAILKLAGCNIYGRMYRVGRIISELSNPCLECRCTEIGVQCRALNC